MDIKKKDLSSIAVFLESVPLSGSVSRNRTKLLNKLKNSLKELQSDEQELVRESGAVVLKNGNLDFENDEKKLSFVRSQEELYQEEVIISEEVVGQFNTLKNSLEEYDGELSGYSAEGFDNILTLLEQESENIQNEYKQDN